MFMSRRALARPGISPPSAPPPRRPPDLAQLVATLEEEIIIGRLKPRERLVEDVLMARFGAKRHLVRQALTRLERLGIVRREPNRGASVRDFSAEEVRHIYAMRELLQGHAAALIPLPAPAALISALRALQAEHAAAAARGDLRTVLRLDAAFHGTLFDAAGNPHLASSIRDYAGLAHAIRAYRVGDPRMLAQAVEEHAAMVAALERGDRVAIVRLCVEHIRPSMQAYLATLAWVGATAA